MVDYDAERVTELVMTLSTYLNHGEDLSGTAAELSIHRGTLRYRLHRIAVGRALT
jgi:DNA-binding PucR family transcriptional regulator